MTCNACNRTIYDRLMSKTSPDNKIWHSECLKCCECNQLLDSKYFETSGRLYCRNHYLTYFGPSCFTCTGKITDEQYFFTIKQTTISTSISSPTSQPPRPPTNHLLPAVGSGDPAQGGGGGGGVGNNNNNQNNNPSANTTTQSNTLFFHEKCFACNFCSRPLQKGDKYCILDNSPAQPPGVPQLQQQQQKQFMICHDICAHKYHSVNQNQSINISHNGANQLQSNMHGVEGNPPPPVRAKRGRQKQNRPA